MLKDLCYDTYLGYQHNQIIDYNKFNLALAKIQNDNLDFESLGLSDPIILRDESKKVFFNDETEYFFDDYLTNAEISMSESDKQYLLKMSLYQEQFEEDIKLFLNYLKSYSIQLDALVNYVSFGRCLTIFKILYQDGSIKLNNKFEFYIVEEAFKWGIGRFIVSAHHYDDCIDCSDQCDKHLKYFSLCRFCLTVNKTKKEYGKPKDVPLQDWICDKQVWYDQLGKLTMNEHTRSFHDKFIYREQIFHSTSKMNFRNMVENDIQEAKKLEEYNKSQKKLEFDEQNRSFKNFRGFGLPKEQIEYKNEMLGTQDQPETYDNQINIPKSPFFNETNSVGFFSSPVKSSFSFSSSSSSTFVNNSQDNLKFCEDCKSEFTFLFGEKRCLCSNSSFSFSSKKISRFKE
jgi:hypothetical protein